MYIMTLFDWYSGGLNVIIIALCEVAGIAWIYGTNSMIYASCEEARLFDYLFFNVLSLWACQTPARRRTSTRRPASVC